MNTNNFSESLRRAAPIVAGIEVLTVLYVLGGVLFLGRQQPIFFSMALVFAGVFMIFLGAVRPINTESEPLEREWFHAGAITGELLFVGVLNIIAGILLLAL